MNMSPAQIERLGFGGDPRITPARADLAASHLKEQVQATRFVSGREGVVVVNRAALRAEPDTKARLLTEILFGEHFTIYELNKSWVWGQAPLDGYVGYLPASAISPRGESATHRVSVPLTHVYPAPDIKAPPVLSLPMTARLSVTGSAPENGLIEIRGSGGGTSAGAGWVWAQHLAAMDRPVENFVNTALGFMGAPYLWGGKTIAGIDCSGLVQLALAMMNIAVPRDSDMQAGAIGERIEGGETLQDGAELQRGDVVFFPDHVGIMLDTKRLLHANATHMMVTANPLTDVVAGIAEQHDQPISEVRRIP